MGRSRKFATNYCPSGSGDQFDFLQIFDIDHHFSSLSFFLSHDDQAPDPLQFLGGVHLDGIVRGDDHPDPVAVFQGPELFEGLQPLQDPLRQGREGAQESAAVGIDPVVLEVVGLLPRSRTKGIVAREK